MSWQELAAKLTGTARNAVREPWFSPDELKAAMNIVAEARQATAGMEVEPRNWKPLSQRHGEVDATPEKLVAPAAADTQASAELPAAAVR